MLVAVLCQGLVGPMLDLCDADGFGIHLFGKSSSGKTTAAVLAASIWGPPERFVRSWRTTSTAWKASLPPRTKCCSCWTSLSKRPRRMSATPFT